MAYVTLNGRKRWELRESHSTARGPRSRTLATFEVLGEDEIERARERSRAGLSPDDVRRAALRAGAPIAGDPVEEAAATVLRHLRDGLPLRKPIEGMLVDALKRTEPASKDIGDAARWIGASAADRASTLVDLLEFGDALPFGGRGDLEFPRLETR